MDFGFSFLPSVGNSGGILSIWNASLAKLPFSFSGTGFVDVCLELSGEEKRCYVVNVYSQGNLAEKKVLWDNIIMSYRGFGEGLWCIVGDFNVVRSPAERKGTYRAVDDEGRELRRGFNQFIKDLELADLPLLGRKFTWYRSNGSTMSRLDRFLLSNNWLVRWGGCRSVCS